MDPIDNHLQADTTAHPLKQITTPFHTAWFCLPTGHHTFHCIQNGFNAGVLCSIIPGDSPKGRVTTSGGSLVWGGLSTGVVGQRWMVVCTQLSAAMPLMSLVRALPLRLAHVREKAVTSLHLTFNQGGTLATHTRHSRLTCAQSHPHPVAPDG